MLALSPPWSCLNSGQDAEEEGSEKGKIDFSVDNLVDILDFDDFFLDTLLPEQQLLSDFSVPELTASPGSTDSDSKRLEEDEQQPKKSITQPGNKKQKKSKKPKVDWTPELHRRFVQAVEQLGVEKAVPSRILQLMGIDTLTRHNIASHLQKYRSHQKHLQTRCAGPATWNHRGAGNTPATTIGFPPATVDFRHLHVWGHPSGVDQSFTYMWPNPLSQPPALSHHHVPTLGTACFPLQYPAPPVPGIPGLGLHQTPALAHPSTGSVDAAIGEVLSKPWMPMPLGLKPPSVDGVIAELQRQGISKMPPA